MFEEQQDDNRREHTRFTLRDDPETPLTLACDGVSVRISKRGFWRDKEIALASLKDVSKGGAGFITASQLPLNETLILELNGFRIDCEVLREQPIQGALRFYGVRWRYEDTAQLVALFAEISRLKGA
ncbi:PilZ domain-containing protein [Ferrimonas marina]|uniref:PilZ domain-containing protein n=2 Tax=Ferrimonas marina TaxID=299255 RepID=A0A1M5QTN8_9GAMM|nr:PilZ domain-containing protein [Ferrimonas marina]SHH17328.1 PilZ domain-containing protein [Ferrimonas marina]